MLRAAIGTFGLSLTLATAAMAQTAGGEMQATTRTVVTPVAPPATVVAEVEPGTFVVTPVPGVAAATQVKIQQFSDYDVNNDGAYSPMEFAQATYFLATSDPVAGNPTLPSWDRYEQRGTLSTMEPDDAVDLLNATADEFAVVDLNNDWEVSPAELTAVAML